MDAVLLMAYGSPRSIENIADYYTDIRGGTRPSAEQLDKLVQRYKAIGGASPLYEITEKQASGLQDLLDPSKDKVRVYFGMKHADPFIKDVIAKMQKEKIERLACIALAPHYSITGIGSYISRVKDADSKNERKPKLEFVESWHLNPWLIKFWSERIRKAAAGAGDFFVIFTAHSLPEAVEDKGPYRKQLLETSEAIAKASGIRNWGLAFQSQSGRGEKWYGPTIKELIESDVKDGKSVIIAPIGFVSDNLEILYDLDIELKKWASENGITLKRAEMPNASEELIHALADAVKGKI